MGSDFARDQLRVEEPEGFTQVPDSLLLNRNVSDGAYRLYAVLKHHARQGNSAYPGKKLLARELGVKSTRTIDARINELKEAGYLAVTARYHSQGGQTSNDYFLFFYPRRTRETVEEQGVQSAAPSPGNSLHPADANDCAPPVQPAAHQGSTSPLRTPSPTTPARRKPKKAGGGEGQTAPSTEAASFAAAVIDALPGVLYPRTRAQVVQATALLEPLNGYGTPAEVARKLSQMRPLPEHVTHPLGLLRSRINDLPAPTQKPKFPDWCGECDERTRNLWNENTDKVSRCPQCHPLTVRS